MKRIIILALLLSAPDAMAGLPVRLWEDEMPQHTFSLGLGPSWFSNQEPVLNLENAVTGGDVPVGFDFTMRYDWAYLRGYDVSMGIGPVYVFSHSSYPVDGSASAGRNQGVRENLHYLGANFIDVKMWFGKRYIWDVALHGGYIVGSSTVKRDSGLRRVGEHGFAGGISTGVDCFITAWLGVGLHFNIMGSTLNSAGSSRDYTGSNLRLGVVYCF